MSPKGNIHDLPGAWSPSAIPAVKGLNMLENVLWLLGRRGDEGTLAKYLKKKKIA